MGPGTRQFFIREFDRETARIILAHFFIGIAARGPFAKARNIHGPHIKTGVAIHHPLRQRQANATALAEARHHTTSAPEIFQALHRPHQGIAIGRESERPIDHALDANIGNGRKMFVTQFQVWRNSVKIRLQ